MKMFCEKEFIIIDIAKFVCVLIFDRVFVMIDECAAFMIAKKMNTL